MALTLTLLDATTESVNDTTVTSGTIEPTGGALLLVLVGCRENAATTIDSCADTLTDTSAWTEQDEVDYTEDAGSNYTCGAIYTAVAGGTPGSGTITVTFNRSLARKIIFVYEVTGFDPDTPIRQTKTGSGTSASDSITLDSSPLATSIVVGLACAGGADVSVSPGANYTESQESEIILTPEVSYYQQQSQYDSTPTSTTVDWTNLTTVSNAMLACELQAEAAAGRSTYNTDAQMHGMRAGISFRANIP